VRGAPAMPQRALNEGAPQRPRRSSRRSGRARRRQPAARALRPDRAGLSLRGRSLLYGAAVRRLRQALGDRFVGRVLPDSAANPAAPPFFERVVACPHSVVTAHLIDEAGQPTLAARDEIL